MDSAMPYMEFNSMLSQSLGDSNAMIELNPRTRKERKRMGTSNNDECIRYDLKTSFSFTSEKRVDAVFNSINQRKSNENRMVSKGFVCITGV